MDTADIIQMLLYLVLLIVLAAPLGRYMFKVFSGERTWLDRAAAAGAAYLSSDRD